MKNQSKIISWSLSLFNLLLGVSTGLAILSIAFLIGDLFSNGYYYRGFYHLLSRIGINIIELIKDQNYIGYSLFTSFTNKIIITVTAFLYSSLVLSPIIYILLEIRKIIIPSLTQSPFSEQTTNSLKKIGLTIIIAPAILILYWMLLYFNMISNASYNTIYWEKFSVSIFVLKVFFFLFIYFVVGMFFLTLSNVFRKGYLLKQENDLTV